MNISVINQDLFTVPQGYYLAHCISADFSLGAGIAADFDRVYDMKSKLFKFFWGYEFDGGEALVVDNVYNLVTKERYWNKPTYETLRAALVSMKNDCKNNLVTKIAMPKIGCGLDRLDWDQVEEIIQEVFDDTDVEILVCMK